MKLLIYLACFWAMQVLAYIGFKYGSAGAVGRSRRWLTGFIGGNLFGAGSIYFLMKIYEQMPGNCNVALVLATSGSFIGMQIALSLIFRTRLTPVQWGGVLLVAVGSAISTLGGTGVGQP